MDCLALYDPLLQKSPKGVVCKSSFVKFKIEVDLKCVPNVAYLMIKSDNESDYHYVMMERNDNFFETTYYFEESGHYFYNFKLNYNDFEKYLSRTYDSYSIVLDRKGDDFLQLVTSEEYTSKNSLQGGVIYQILVDRFCKVGEVKSREPLVLRDDWGGKIKKNTTNPILINEEVFGGNFSGVRSKLRYLKELNVTAIYFNPISLANSHHKYDTADYMKIDDMFGGEKEFKLLIEDAKKLGIKIIIDGVYNHTGSDSIYFNKKNSFDTVGAFNSPSSKYFEWFRFIDYPEKYESWWGIDTLPSIKQNSESFQNFIAGENGVIEKFLKLGVFGIRLDVVDELTDEFTKKISKKITSFDKNAVVMGEVWEDASTKISYSKRRKYFTENELNSVMNYPIRESIIEYLRSKEPYSLNSTIRMLLNNYPKVVRDNLMNFLGTHDTSRIFTELKKLSSCGGEFALFKVAMTLLFTLPGVPSIFYGDEYGMEDNDGSSRGCFDWGNYNNNLFEFTKKLSSIRKMFCLKDGEINILMSGNGKFVFERFNSNEHIVVMSNLRPSNLKVKLDGKFKSFFSPEIVIKDEMILSENQVEILIETK